MVSRGRRETEWFSQFVPWTALAGDAQTNQTLYNAVTHGLRFIKGATVTRIILDMYLRAVVVSEDTQLFFGILVMNADARAAGAFPEADDMTDRPDWMIRGVLQNRFTVAITTQLSTLKEYDLRAQRVLRSEEDELQLILDNGNANALSFSLFIRVLMKLP